MDTLMRQVSELKRTMEAMSLPKEYIADLDKGRQRMESYMREEQAKASRYHSECKKLKAQVTFLKDQNHDLHRDNIKLTELVERVTNHGAKALSSKICEAGGCLKCATLLLENERLTARVQKLETIMNYKKKEALMDSLQSCPLSPKSAGINKLLALRQL